MEHRFFIINQSGRPILDRLLDQRAADIEAVRGYARDNGLGTPCFSPGGRIVGLENHDRDRAHEPPVDANGRAFMKAAEQRPNGEGPLFLPRRRHAWGRRIRDDLEDMRVSGMEEAMAAFGLPNNAVPDPKRPIIHLAAAGHVGRDFVFEIPVSDEHDTWAAPEGVDEITPAEFERLKEHADREAARDE